MSTSKKRQRLSVRYVLNALALLVLTGFWSTIAFPAMLFPGAVTWVARTWARQMARFCGVRVEVSRLQHLDAAPSFLVMANHSSHFDVISIYGNIVLDMRPVAKRELGFIPVFGWALAAGAAIMIDRKSKARAVASIARAAKTIQGGRSVLMFPEGTRTADSALQSLKKGPFHLAVAAQVPILPVFLEGTAAILAPGDWRIHSGVVQMTIGKPIVTAGRGDDEAARIALMTEVEEAFKALKSGRIRA